MELDHHRISIKSKTPITRPSVPPKHQLKIITGMVSDDILALPERSCAICPANELNICGASNRINAVADQRIENLPLKSYEQKIPARKVILHPKEYSEDMSIICSGWAFSAIALSDGRQQILSFLHSGDVVSASAPWVNRSGRQVVAITDVTVRRFKGSDVKGVLQKGPHLLDVMARIWNENQTQADELLVSLGRRRAEGRIARLILLLMNKLIKRGMMAGQTMMFPLRQRHIADATGLTDVHVSKVLGEFQRNGLIAIQNRSLTVLDIEGLQRVIAA